MSNKVDTILMPDGRRLDLGGIGVPDGGLKGQVLGKKSDLDKDVTWLDSVVPDNATIIRNADGSITAIGQLSKNNEVNYWWFGTWAQYMDMRSYGELPSNWIYYIMDYNDELVSDTSRPRVAASTEYVDNKVDPFQSDYSEFKVNTLNTLSALKEVDTNYGERLNNLEEAVGTLLDELNGEII